jgi:hypothetical protein
MKLSIRALVIVVSLLWGGAVLLVGLANLMSPSYGVAFLQMVSSIYPGFHAAGTIVDVLVGTIYALVDGALCGLFFGWLYNGFAVGWSRPGVR